ncbi:MAG TPA: rubrerythrin family protein [Mobilitalea sp.]|nr:rubrerythrin family protein [Mobilitalea sp.]
MNYPESKNFMESNTYKNLTAAFKGETSASGKYALYGIYAREDGFEQIGNIFDETSRNEREHAEIWFKILHGGEVPSTLENLKDAYSGENYEWTTMYMDYATEADREGYPEIARLFEGIAAIERHHDARFRKLAHNIMYDQVFCKKENSLWVCLNCGNLYYGECAPDPCPVCDYPQGYYQLNCENY